MLPQENIKEFPQAMLMLDILIWSVIKKKILFTSKFSFLCFFFFFSPHVDLISLALQVKLYVNSPIEVLIMKHELQDWDTSHVRTHLKTST